MNDARLGGSPAHVEGHGVLEPERAAQRLRADHAGGRARLEHAHALQLRLPRFIQAARRLHQQERSAESGLLQMRVYAAEILAHHRADVGVRGDG